MTTTGFDSVGKTTGQLGIAPKTSDEIRIPGWPYLWTTVQRRGRDRIIVPGQKGNRCWETKGIKPPMKCKNRCAHGVSDLKLAWPKQIRRTKGRQRMTRQLLCLRHTGTNHNLISIPVLVCAHVRILGMFTCPEMRPQGVGWWWPILLPNGLRKT